MKKQNIIVIVCMIVCIIILTLIGIYIYQTSPVDKTSDIDIKVTIPEGSSSKEISKILKEKDLIKSSNFFLFYIKINNKKSLKASTYILKKSMSLSEIITVLEKGNSYNPDEIKITFNEGINMRKVAKIIDSNTNNSYDDVLKKLKDDTYIKTLIEKYWFLSDKILNQNIYYPLEGFLFPDTYIFKNKDVTIEEIFTAMLDNMDKVLTPYKDTLTKNNQDIFDIITMASLVELEGAPDDQRKEIVKDIASVFYNRIDSNMNLGSDVTTYYAVKVDMNERDLYASEINTYNPYNTRGPQMEGKLPIGPICIVSKISIDASINPNKTDYLYFVADKYKNVFFTKTYSEHTEKVQEIKDKGDWIEW